MDGHRFEGRIILVAGTTGIAASTARAIASEGGSVFLTSRTTAHVEALAAEIGGSGGRVGHARAELTDEADVDAVVAACLDCFGRLDGVYAVAGITGRKYGDGPLDVCTLEGWRTVMTANAESTFLIARAAVRQMLAQEPDEQGIRGALLLMSSDLARHPSPAFFATHAYAASKGAIESFGRAIASYYAPSHIRVNVIAPALTATPMSRRVQEDPAILAYLHQKQPLATNGVIESDEVTGAALFLLSGESARVTGQVLAVDAGWGVSEPRLTAAPVEA
jgi:NAD(P)-dependent dehydrogenase (short-subunit alcohol dehydrogenase family)